MNYRIISDSDCDLDPAVAEQKNITVVPFYVSFDETTYQKEREEIGVREFYERMVKEPGVFPKSSMPSTQDYIDVFTPAVEAGEAVICMCITVKFSGSYQSAMTAKEMVLEQYPDAKITVMDTTMDTVLQGLFVLEAVKLRDRGVPYEEAVARLEAIKATGRIFFTVGSVDYLQHGGRIGKVASAAVSVLGIKPLITLKEGEIFSSGIARGRKKSIDKVIVLLKEYLRERNATPDTYEIVVGYGYDIEEGEALRQRAMKELQDEFGAYQIDKYQIGATIGVHTGPYPLGFGVLKRA